MPETKRKRKRHQQSHHRIHTSSSPSEHKCSRGTSHEVMRSGACKSSQIPGFHRRQRHRNSYKSSSADKTQIRSSHIPRYLGPEVEGQSKPLFARCPGLVAAGHCRACCVDHCRGLAAAGLWLACCGVDHSLGHGVGLLERPETGCCWQLGS